MSESSLERSCRTRARLLDGWLLKLLPWAMRGLPDRLLVLPGGRIAFLEFKVGKNGLRSSQSIWRDRLIHAGLNYAIVRTPEDFNVVARLLLLDQRIPMTFQL